MTGLRVEHLTKSFGGLVAANNVSFTVAERSITGLIGPNGSGKTVTLDCITGFHKPDRGRVFFWDREITGRGPNEIALNGLARSFQITGVLSKLTVLQNLVFAAQEKRMLRNISRSLRSCDGSDPQGSEQIENVLQSLKLQDLRDEIVGNLSYGQQKILEFAGLVLMQPAPVFYLLDEPFAGLTQLEISRYVSFIKALRNGGKSFLIVEHNMRVMMNLCDRIIVLDHGENIAEGSPVEIQANRHVVEAYLGHASTPTSS